MSVVFSRPRSLATALAVAFPTVGIYLWQASAFAGWVVDDAGITFAYARNLVLGYGLVAQPGAAAVEGFTSILWCLLQVPFLALGVFEPVATPKMLAAWCVAVAFVALGWWLVRRGEMRPLVAGSALATTALFPGFFMWCASGLENALYCALLASLLVAIAVETHRPRFAGALAGVLVFLIFCTRPEGILYLWLPPFLSGSMVKGRAVGAYGSAFTVAFAVPWLTVTTVRILYFHDVLPNTFYAKQAKGSQFVAAILDSAGVYVGGTILMALWLAGLVTGVVLFQKLGLRFRARLSPPALTPALFLATAVIVHLVLPGDWMPEYRFATPVFLFLPATVVGLAGGALRRSGHGGIMPIGLVAAAVLGLTALYGFKRTPELANNPVIPFDSVRALAARVAVEIDPDASDMSVLTPDIGGALWENRFRVLDLAGLVDRNLARRRDWQSRRDYLLSELRPDVILLHTYWMEHSGFLADPRFVSAYSQVWSAKVMAAGLWLRHASP